MLIYMRRGVYWQDGTNNGTFNFFYSLSLSAPKIHINIAHTIISRPLYRSTCVSRHLQLRTGGFCWCKVLLLGLQPAYSYLGEDAGVLLNSVIYTVSVPVNII